MKIIYLVVLILAFYSMPVAAFDVKLFGLRFGAGEEETKVDASQACTQVIVKPKPKPAVKPASKPKPATVLVKSTATIKLVAEDKEEEPKTAKEKPEYLVKAEKAVKVKKPHKRDWTTLGADSMGAAGIAYGARKSNWFIGSGGAAILLYSLIAERNTNSFLDQTVAVGTGIGLGYLPKISSDKDEKNGNNSNPVPLPPPPAP